MIGSLGEVAFEVSSKKVFTFGELSRERTARINFHERLGGLKPLAEFIGPGVESISFTIRLSRYLGVDPLAEVATLRKMCDSGTAASFSLDGKPQGDGLWLVESIKETWRNVDNKGNPTEIDCDIQLKEYMEK